MREKRIRNALSVFIVFFFSFLYPIKIVKAEEVVHVGGLVFPPYIFMDGKNKPAGILVDMIKSASRNLDLKVKFEISNWARAFKQVKEGQLDALIPTMYSIERSKHFYFPKQHIIEFDISLFRHVDKKISFDGKLDTLKQYKIGKIRGAKVAPDFDKAISNELFTIEERNSVALLIRGLNLERLDLIATDYPTAMWVAKKEQLSHVIKRVNPPLGKVRSFLAFSRRKTKPGIVLKYDQEITRLVVNGSLDHFVERYLD